MHLTNWKKRLARQKNRRTNRKIVGKIVGHIGIFEDSKGDLPSDSPVTTWRAADPETNEKLAYIDREREREKD